jgi:hypothetical protein
LQVREKWIEDSHEILNEIVAHNKVHFSIHIEISELEISRLICKEYGQINYDAKACYDRISPNIAAMLSWVNGLTDKIVNQHNNLLLKMKHNVMIEGARG